MAFAPRNHFRGVAMFIAAAAAMAICAAPAVSQQGPATEARVPAADGVPIAYEVHGTGSSAVVLVHGWSTDRRYWRDQVGPLSEIFRVITVDLAGHGGSGTHREDWTIQSFGGDVASVVEHLFLEDVVLVGHSMGGDVVLEAARRLPGKVKGLVWLDTYSELGSPRTRGEIEEIVRPFRTDFEGTVKAFIQGAFSTDAERELVEWVARDMAAAPPEIALSALESSFSYGRGVTIPVEDLGVPLVAINPEGATEVASLEKFGIDVRLMPGVGHFLMMEDPHRFNELLLDVIHDFR